MAAPKPNTRFLRNILRDTDNHNATLLAKERREAQERQHALTKSGLTNEKPSASLGRARHEYKHRRSHRSRSPSYEHGRQRGYDDGLRSAANAGQTDHEQSRARHSDHRSYMKGHRHRHRHERRDRSRSRSREHRSSRRKRRSKEARSRSRSPVKDRPSKHSKKPSSSKVQEEARLTKANETTTSRSVPVNDSGNVEADSDSDPLDAIIGPAPSKETAPAHSRGRGAHRTAISNIDAHFHSSYDPQADIHPDSGTEDDWAQALEGLRDRQKWMQKGAERLLDAGFTDEQVKKWETGGVESESNVNWTKKGESREWDKGKRVDGDENLGSEAESTWGRLKGT